MSPKSPSTSKREFARAKRSIPGGVNSPVRAYGSVGGVPPFVESARGCRIRDIDGREFIDYVGSWGPMILGHAHPKVLAAEVPRGASKGAWQGPDLAGTRFLGPGGRILEVFGIKIAQDEASVRPDPPSDRFRVATSAGAPHPA